MGVKVYYKKNPDFRDPKIFKHSEYDFICEVETSDLNEAFELTQNLTEEHNMETLHGVKARSASVGDVFVSEGVKYGVCGVGFNVINDSPEEMGRVAKIIDAQMGIKKSVSEEVVEDA